MTKTTKARPAFSGTNSMCFKGASSFGATTTPAHFDNPDNVAEA